MAASSSAMMIRNEGGRDGADKQNSKPNLLCIGAEDSPSPQQMSPIAQLIIGVLNPILTPLIQVSGHFMGRLLSHPDVQLAVGAAVVSGVKQLCHESDLHSHLTALDETISQHQEEDARKLGRDLKNTAGHFFKGMFMENEEEEVKSTKKEDWSTKGKDE